jgi:hypothetical protein
MLSFNRFAYTLPSCHSVAPAGPFRLSSEPPAEGPVDELSDEEQGADGRRSADGRTFAAHAHPDKEAGKAQP